VKEDSSVKEFWGEYGYTDPVAAALTAAFGVEFLLEHTGGGCVVLCADIDDATYINVGSAADGPLLTDSERSQFAFNGGWHIGAYESEGGFALADASDYTAVSPDEVIVLIKTALQLVPRCTEATRVAWKRDVNGVVTEEIWPR
jgi:hypothetical protein